MDGQVPVSIRKEANRPMTGLSEVFNAILYKSELRGLA
jgi:hypothetical protein